MNMRVIADGPTSPTAAGQLAGKPQFRPDVEGMRAVAVGLVLAYHAFAHPFTGGCVGVDVFFVISGFLITSLLLRENTRSGRISIAGFYARRVRRILPASTVVVLATVLFAYYFLGFVTGNSVAKAATWTAFFAANVYFGFVGTNYTSSHLPPSPLDHMWSLGVEEQFYVVWPLLFLAMVLIVRGPRHRGGLAAMLGAIIVVSLAWSVIRTESNATWAYLSPLTRGWELAFGALIAVLAPTIARIPRDWILQAMAAVGLLAILASSLLLDGHTPYPGSAALLPVVGSGLLVAAGCATPGTLVGRALALAPMQWIGARSYSLYIWHWPVLCLAALYAGHDLSTWQNAVLLVGAVAISAVSYSLLENPVRRSTFLATHTRATLVFGATLIAVTVAIAQALIATHYGHVLGAESTAPSTNGRTFATSAQVLAAVEAAQTVTQVPGGLVADLTKPEPTAPAHGFDCTKINDKPAGATSFGECVYGAATGDKLAVVYGDSRAAMWSTPIIDVAAENGWKVRVFSLDGCPAPNLRFFSSQSDTPNTQCDDFHRAALDAIVALKPQLVITSSVADQALADGSDPSPADWGDGWRATYAALAPTGAKFVMMGDIPTWSNDDAHCLARALTQLQDCAAAPADALPDGRFVTAEKSAVESVGGQYVSTTPWVCAKECEPVIAGRRVYADQFHFTVDYGDYLAGAVGEALRPVMG